MTAPLQPTLHTHNDFGTANVVETPTSPSSAFTLSRFEFEAGTKGNEGTKILMVEWDATAALKAAAAGRGDGQETQSAASEQQEAETSASPDEWEVRWEGKEILSSNNTVIGIPDPETPPSTCRVYFLLPPKAPIPTLVTIAHAQGAVADLHAKPLPAIFPEGLVKQQHGGGDAHDEDKKTKKKKEGLRSGTRGVLHTIWAELRVAQLDAEVAAEMRVNGEGVGLEMALQERQWIVERFGLQVDTSSAEAIPPAPEAAGSPASPRSPMGGRLGEKLKGLKLATSPAELAAAKEGEYLLTYCTFCLQVPL